MSCRRVCRELLSFVRFGELGPRSQPHLDHLAGCASCRDEVGYDREMVQRLRAALAARIEGMDPSPQVWEQILRRAQAPDPEPAGGWLSRLGAVAARRRTTTAMAGTALALVLALNMEVVSIMPSMPTDASMEAVLVDTDGVGSQRWARPSAVRSQTTVGDPVGPRGVVITRPEIRMTGIVAGLTPPSAAAAPPEPAAEVVVVFRSVEPVGPLADDDRLDVGSAAQEEPRTEPEPQPAASPAEPGQPS
ncbi:MAG TPA: anti-sigma factor [Patescibacteria group bacterium]|nr:anti-sigma factor [Patescibacteria group bacterium]